MRWFHVGPTTAGFRYLHDEISGGITAYSHLLCKAAYLGQCASIGVNNYGFVSNIVDIASIVAGNPGAAKVNIYYDQLSNANLSTSSAGSWDGATNQDFIFTGGMSMAAGGMTFANLTSASPFTFIGVVDVKTAATGTQAYVHALEIAGLAFWSYYFIDDNFRVGFIFPRQRMNRYAGIRTTGIKLFCITYDGSETLGGIKLYVNDMVTALVPSATINNGGVFNANIYGRQSFGSAVNNASALTNALKQDAHTFGRVLSQSDREKAKVILEQYYTFP